MHIAVDCDDVMLDFIGMVRKCFRKEFGFEGIPDYSGSPWGEDVVAFTKHPSLLAAGYKSWWDWLRERDWLWGTADAVDGAIGGVKTLRAQGHYLEMVTSKPEWAEPQVWRWLGKWRPPFHRVTIVNSKEQKVDVTDARLIIDDKVDTVKSFADAGRWGIVFDRGRVHTMEAMLSPRIEVAHNWDDVLKLVDDIARREVVHGVA